MLGCLYASDSVYAVVSYAMVTMATPLAQLMQQISANEAQRRQRMVAALSDKTRAGPAPSSWIRGTAERLCVLIMLFETD
jgi:hypothetical protein